MNDVQTSSDLKTDRCVAVRYRRAVQKAGVRDLPCYCTHKQAVLVVQGNMKTGEKFLCTWDKVA